MKLCKLKLKNLNSFREEIEIDFEKSPLDDASLVAITGPTGAGKTTLLDAICVALYGKTPRLSGIGSQNSNHLISHGEKEGFAEVHFMANGTRYIAAWSIKRGSPAKVRLSYAENDKLISDRLSTRGKSLGPSQKTVSEEVESILGLDFDAFKRSVMLAQGEFAAFLKASNEERRTILEATAGIGIYDLLKNMLNKKVGEVEAANADVIDKLKQIPDASHEQLSEAETELARLKEGAEALGVQSQQVQQERERETKRKDDFAQLQSSEKRQKELLDQLSEIEVLQTERENAERANSLRPEKQAFDTAKSDLKEAKEALQVATTKKTAAEKQVEVDQSIFDKKEMAYQTASDERDRKIEVYIAAKLDVARAADQFTEVDNRMPKLAELDDQIDTVSDQLTSSGTEQAQLQEQVKDAQTYLNESHLPSNRQQRLTDATSLLTKLGSQENQLETTLASKLQNEKKGQALEREIVKLSKTRDERISEKTEAETALKSATTELDALLKNGTHDEWNTRKQQAVQAQPITQKYETVINGLRDLKKHLGKLNETKAAQRPVLKQIENELSRQTEAYQGAMEKVEHCEEALKFVMLANPINQLRQRLQSGEPCLVCGATDHPCADVLEPEGEGLLQDAENALKHAKADAQAAQDQVQALKTEQAQTQQNECNTATQIDECTDEIEELRDEASRLLEQWQEIYPNDDVSSDWVASQIAEADVAIDDLGKANQMYMQSSHAYQTVSEQLENCESDIKRERKSLTDSEEQLQGASDAVEDLQADIASTQERFWEFLPEAFHGVEPDAAVNQFSERIEAVEERETELTNTDNKLNLLNTKIETDQSSLESLRKSRGELQAEIDGYRHGGKAFLDAVRKKTDGLETEDEINAAISGLEAELQTKEKEHDDAQQQLQESRNLLTGKDATCVEREKQYRDCSAKLKENRQIYLGKLDEAGFDSPKAHDDAFRDEAQMRKLTDQIKGHEDEKQQLALEITELRTRFEETPFDPDALGEIEVQADDIGAQLQAKQVEIGAQGERIYSLKDALQKREALGDEIAAAEAELMRWKRLQETIPANDLRDFALEIMFRQMGSLANDQLRYLTSERYQLKVETIGDLSVIDRWNANEERPVETLSGGESFLTSLALALALADLSRGRAQLNSLFLDEGFGTLDTETLDIAIAALEGLRLQGRSIFLISHIQELTRRLPVKISVRKRGNGSSSIQVQG